jgi:hypothetical protein
MRTAHPPRHSFGPRPPALYTFLPIAIAFLPLALAFAPPATSAQAGSIGSPASVAQSGPVAPPTADAHAEAPVPASHAGPRLAPNDNGAAAAAMPPAVVVWHHPGRVPNARFDLQIAIWPDGFVLLRKPADDAGATAADAGAATATHLLHGRCEPAAVAKLLDEIRVAKFADLPHDYLVPCMPATGILVRLDGEIFERKWHGSRTPGVGGNIDKDPDYAAFVHTFERVRAAIRHIEPTDLQRITPDTPAATLRGYNTTEPWRTSWITKK